MTNQFTLMHEHVHLDLSQVKNNPDCHLNDFDNTVAEFRQLKQQGVTRIVDVSNMGIGRNIDYVECVEKQSGVEIVSTTGFYKSPFLPAIVDHWSINQLADLMIDELTIGILHRGQRCGRCAKMIGEIGSSEQGFTELEKKVFSASVIAAQETRKPITTHTTLGKYALEQVAFFKSQKMELSQVILGHVDLSGDIDYIRNLLDSGANVEFDTIGKINYLSDDVRAKILAQLISEGYRSQIFMSVDLTRKSHLAANGGIGYRYLFDSFIPKLNSLGVSQDDIVTILEHNPNRMLG